MLNSFAAVDFPVPIPPVKPTSFIPQRFTADYLCRRKNFLPVAGVVAELVPPELTIGKPAADHTPVEFKLDSRV